MRRVAPVRTWGSRLLELERALVEGYLPHFGLVGASQSRRGVAEPKGLCKLYGIAWEDPLVRDDPWKRREADKEWRGKAVVIL